MAKLLFTVFYKVDFYKLKTTENINQDRNDKVP